MNLFVKIRPCQLYNQLNSLGNEISKSLTRNPSDKLKLVHKYDNVNALIRNKC